EQGAASYHRATGQTQAPFLGRWLLLTAVIFAVSALTYALHYGYTRRRAAATSTAEADIRQDQTPSA
ncbi:MAG: hypothetical protein ACR2FG_02195, partial [Marmoricola sp.]